jgi:hypothetical protein
VGKKSRRDEVLSEENQAIETSWESQVSTKTLDIMLRFLRRLPRIWGAKLRAKYLIKGMPEYEGILKLPKSEEIFAWISGICQTPHRRPGTPEGHKVELWVAGMLKELGLENVKMDPIPITVWSAKEWSLEVGGQRIPRFFVVNTAFTKVEGVTAPLVYVEKGTHKNFSNTDVAGKIVVADVPFPYIPTGAVFRLLQSLGASYIISDPAQALTMRTGQYLNFVRENFIGGATAADAPANDVYWGAYRRGAKGICLILKDQPSNSNSHYGPYDGIMKPMPGLWIGKYDGKELRERAKEGVTATITLQGEKVPGTMHNVWGILPGKSDEAVMVTSHHDAPFQGAVEDGAGVAQVLAQIKIWASVPREKRARTLIFVVGAGHFYGFQGGSRFAREHMDWMKKVKMLITLEHLGAKEVKEKNQKYVETGRPALTVMFTSNEPLAIATVINGLKKKPAKMTVPIPSDLFAPAPISDAAGYVTEAGVPVISWIGCPYYLLDAYDTLRMIAKEELRPICETVTELIKPYMSFKK